MKGELAQKTRYNSPALIFNGETHMKRILVAVAAIAALASNAALASEQLAKEKNCLACHAVDHKWLAQAIKKSQPSTRVISQRKPNSLPRFKKVAVVFGVRFQCLPILR